MDLTGGVFARPEGWVVLGLGLVEVDCDAAADSAWGERFREFRSEHR